MMMESMLGQVGLELHDQSFGGGPGDRQVSAATSSALLDIALHEELASVLAFRKDRGKAFFGGLGLQGGGHL